MVNRIVVCCLALLAFAMPCAAKTAGPLPIEVPAAALAPGEYTWAPALAPAGPMLIVVSLPQQRAYVFRNGVRIGTTTISSGARGHETPPGIYSILERKTQHRSNLYDADMPYMHRLTYDGIALHAGRVTGRPASHGCIRLPLGFAERLFRETKRGMTVVITDEATPAPELVRPGFVLADDPTLREPRLRKARPRLFLDTESAPGPTTVVVSRADASISVFRNAALVGRAPVAISGDEPLGTHAYVRTRGGSFAEPQMESDWMRVFPALSSDLWSTPLVERVTVDPAFLYAVAQMLEPGDTVVVTDEAAANETPSLQVADLGGDAESALAP